MASTPASSTKHCETDKDHPCAWNLIYNRLKEIGQFGRLRKLRAPKDWHGSAHGGARKIVREEHRI